MDSETLFRIKRFRQRIIVISKILVILLTVAACSASSEEDKFRLDSLRQKHDGKLSFRLEEGLYLTANNIDQSRVSMDTAKEIYEDFWFEGNDTNRRRSTSFVYLNVFDRNNEFQFQLAWDDVQKEYKVSNRPYY